MSYLAKQKLIYYRKYKLDIWGLFKNTLQIMHDRTVYKVPNGLFHLKIYKKIKVQQEQSLDDFRERYIRARDLYIGKKVDYEWYIKKKNDYMELFIEAKHIFKKIILSMVLFDYVLKSTISLKMQKIFLFFLKKKKLQQRIYFRKPFIYETREPVMRYKKRRIIINS